MTYRIVIDANILISAVFRNRNPERIIQMAKDSELTLLTSPAILSEVKRVLGYSKFRKYYDEIKRTPDEVYAEYEQLTELVAATTVVQLSELTDKSDSIFLACAVDGKASYVLTGDEHLLKLNAYAGIPIVTPAQFLAILNPPAE